MQFQIQSHGLGLHMRSCFAELEFQEDTCCCLCLQGHHWWRTSAPGEEAFFPFQTAPPCLFLVCFVQGVPSTHWSGVQPIFFSLSFSLRLRTPLSHFLSVDTEAPKSTILMRTIRCLAQSPTNAANNTVADSIWWPFVLTFQPLTNWNWPYLLATVPEAFLLAGFFFFQLPSSFQRQRFLNSGFSLLQQKNIVRESKKIPQTGNSNYILTLLIEQIIDDSD